MEDIITKALNLLLQVVSFANSCGDVLGEPWQVVSFRKGFLRDTFFNYIEEYTVLVYHRCMDVTCKNTVPVCVISHVTGLLKVCTCLVPHSPGLGTHLLGS